MYVFRVHIRPQGGSADVRTTFNYCLRHNVLGVGWRTQSNRNTTEWDEYLEEASRHHRDLNVCKYIHRWVSPDDLVWTRDHLGQYYLARVLSGWEYWQADEAVRLDIDIANVFRCDIKPVDLDHVPGKVVACFRGPRTFQEIADRKAKEYSKHLWNALAQENVYEIREELFADVFMALDAEETEDVVFLYLQRNGWYVIPNSRKGDSMKFEYLCVNPDTGEVAGTQVKTGDSYINKDEYSNSNQRVFLFQSGDLYQGEGTRQTEVISRSQIENFLVREHAWLPGAIQRKVAMASGKLDIRAT